MKNVNFVSRTLTIVRYKEKEKPRMTKKSFAVNFLAKCEETSWQCKPCYPDVARVKNKMGTKVFWNKRKKKKVV